MPLIPQRLRCLIFYLYQIFLVLPLLFPLLANAASCTITSTSTNFGNYDPFSSTPDDTVGRVTINCTSNNSAYTIFLSTGQSGSYSQRRMNSGSNLLNYNLYTNAARSIICGNGTSGTSFISGNCNKCTRSIPVYGRIPINQNANIGTYQDTITATANF